MISLNLDNIEIFADSIFVILEKNSKGLIQEVSCSDFLISFSLF